MIENTGNLNRPAASFPNPQENLARNSDFEKLEKLDLISGLGQNKTTLTFLNPYHFKAYISEYKKVGARVRKRDEYMSLISMDSGSVLKVILSKKHIDLETSISLLRNALYKKSEDAETIENLQIILKRINATARSLKAKNTKTKLKLASAEEILSLHSPEAASTKPLKPKTKNPQAKKKKRNTNRPKPTNEERIKSARLRKGKDQQQKVTKSNSPFKLTRVERSNRFEISDDLKELAVDKKGRDDTKISPKQEKEVDKRETEITLSIKSSDVIKHLAAFLSQKDNPADPHSGFFTRESDGNAYIIDNQRKIKITIRRKPCSQSTTEEIRQISKDLRGVFKELNTSSRAYMRSAGRNQGIDEQIAKERDAKLELINSENLFDSQDTVLLKDHPDGLLPYDSAQFLSKNYLENLRKRQFHKILKNISLEIRSKIPNHLKPVLNKLLIKFIYNQIDLESLTFRLGQLLRYELSARNAGVIKDKLKRFKIKVIRLSEWLAVHNLPEQIKKEIQSGIDSEKFRTVASLNKSSHYAGSIKKKLPRFSMMIAGYMAEARVESVIVEKFINTGLVKSMDTSLPFSPSDNHKLDLAMILHDGSEVFLQIKNNEDDLEYFDAKYKALQEKYKRKNASLKMHSFPHELPSCATISVANKSRTELENEIFKIINKRCQTRMKSGSANVFKYREWTKGNGPQEFYKNWPPEKLDPLNHVKLILPKKLRVIKKI